MDENSKIIAAVVVAAVLLMVSGAVLWIAIADRLLLN
jgi:hypothetical protein